METGKVHGPSACPQCGAVYHKGRWRWLAPPEGAETNLCPACRRIAEGHPAGIILLGGRAVAEHRDDLVRLARNQEEAEKGEHPLNRIMEIKVRAPDELEITTTDVHLPARIGHAVKRAYHGDLSEDFDEDAYFVRVIWRDTRGRATE